MKKLLVIAMCAMAAAQPAGQSQTAAPVENAVQGPTFRTGVDVIAVDVAVIDGRGRPVEGLLPPDFVVKIDGVERRIVSAEHVRIDVEAARRQAAEPDESFFSTNLTPPNGRLIVIAVDQLGIRTGEARVVLATASKFLDTLTPADQVAFVAYPDPGIYVDFTNDRIRLRQAMERIVGSQQSFIGKFNIGLTEAIAIIERSDAIMFAAVFERECGRRLRGDAAALCERDILAETREMVRNLRRDSSASVNALAGLLRRMAPLEGPKSLILLSEGLILENPTDIDDVVQTAALSRVSVNVLLMDVPIDNMQSSQRPPTATEDRQMQLSGLRNLAWGSGGDLFHVVGTGENIFERLSSELAAYYILGVEQQPSDRDGAGHRIDVEVRRNGLTVRSRRAFSLTAAAGRGRSPEDMVTDTLRSPFGVAEVPLRVTTFARQELASGKVRLLVAADVGQPGATPQPFTIGYVLVDQEGRVAAGGGERRTLSPANGNASAALEFMGEVVVDPGVYSLRLAIVDAEGRRAGVVREVNAWRMSGQEFALGDLMVGNVAGANDLRVRPGVEPRVRGDIGAYIEFYSSSATALDGASVLFEIASEENGPPLVVAPAQLATGTAPTVRVAAGTLAPGLLPAGRYVARARVMRNGSVAGLLARPFIIDRETAVAGAPLDTAILVFQEVGAFDSKSVLAGDVVAAMLDSVEKSTPDLKAAIAEARAGRYADAAITALASGDQAAAAFLKGLDWYVKGQMDQALMQLQLAAGPRREFFPGAFYLGASLAAAGRDRDAAGVWQLAIGTEPRPSLAYTMFADARLRDQQPASVIDVLKPAYDRNPADEAISRRLITAYLLTERYREAIPVLDVYLTRNPADQQALFAAVYAQYQVSTRERVSMSTAEVEKVQRYVRAYRGPSQALVERYFDTIR